METGDITGASAAQRAGPFCLLKRTLTSRTLKKGTWVLVHLDPMVGETTYNRPLQ